MSRALKYDIPGCDFRVYRDASGEPPGLEGWREIFAPDVSEPAPFIVDIGFGRGELLIHLANDNPTQAYVGIERSFKRTLKMARRLARLGIGNVRLVEARAEEGITEFFPLGSIACAWINFPDPWPKGRHARRRLIQRPFIHDLALRLVPGGSLNLATDDPSYAAQMAEVLAGEPLLENRNAPDAFRGDVTGRIPTAYELEWRAQGRSCHYFAYRRKQGEEPWVGR
ncbi:MAG: tRNA (guanosine(46)-N7)-methyltransferase TrmB [Myxococcota bacterium]